MNLDGKLPVAFSSALGENERKLSTMVLDMEASCIAFHWRACCRVSSVSKKTCVIQYPDARYPLRKKSAYGLQHTLLIYMVCMFANNNYRHYPSFQVLVGYPRGIIPPDISSYAQRKRD